MLAFMVVRRPLGTEAAGPRYSGQEYTSTGGVSVDSDEVHLPDWVMVGIPTRHLVEELSRRAGCVVVVDDVPVEVR